MDPLVAGLCVFLGVIAVAGLIFAYVEGYFDKKSRRK